VSDCSRIEVESTQNGFDRRHAKLPMEFFLSRVQASLRHGHSSEASDGNSIGGCDSHIAMSDALARLLDEVARVGAERCCCNVGGCEA